MSLFETIANSLAPHPEQAQMVLGLGPSSPSLPSTLEMLALCGITWSGPQSAATGAEAVLVIRSKVPACQHAVIKLTENGFKKLQAVYPLEPKV